MAALEATIPPRSRLFSLRPIGIGTSRVESITSYVARLAEAHCVTVGDLVDYLLVPLKSGRICRSHSYGRRSHLDVWINAACPNVDGYSRLLERLTRQEDIHRMTLYPLTSLMQGHNVLRWRRSWCPVCLAQLNRDGSVLYEPLVWSVEFYTICTVHKCWLRETCPRCGGFSGPTDTNLRVGFCPKCGAWLGDADRSTPSEKADFEWWLWLSRAMETLVATFQLKESQAPDRDAKYRLIRAYTDMYLEGDRVKLVEKMHCIRTYDTSDILSGEFNFGPDLWLVICRLLQLSPLSFFTGTVELDKEMPRCTAEQDRQRTCRRWCTQK